MYTRVYSRFSTLKPWFRINWISLDQTFILVLSLLGHQMRNLWGCFLLWPLPWNLLPRAYFTAPANAAAFAWEMVGKRSSTLGFKDLEGCSRMLKANFLKNYMHSYIYIHIDVNLDGTHCWNSKWMASRLIAQHSTEEGAQLAYGTPSLETSYLLYISVCMFSRVKWNH